MSYLWTGGYPRNTSNGDYGRFLFTTNQNSNANGSQGNFTAYPSSDGNRMVHHAHYPNCPNRYSQNGQQPQQTTGGNGSESNGMPDYTIEYGEDAVRAALGGEMPDFQSQYMQQVNGGSQSGGVSVDSQNIQMMNNGKSRVAMIPVVFASGGDDDDQQQTNDASNNAEANVSSESNSTEQDNSQPQSQAAAAGDSGTGTPKAQSVKPPKKENIINAYNSVRQVRSSGQVKYGRHIRPSYWNPQVPNPCRKKMGSGDFLPELPKCTDEPSGASTMPPAPEINSADMNGMKMMGNAKNTYSTPPMMASQHDMQQGVQPPPQRTRSMPLKKHIRPTNSLCGKCSKCKNLNTTKGEPPVLAFPAYSPGTRRSVGSSTLNSSNLGQSAKNFRAIRFSST